MDSPTNGRVHEDAAYNTIFILLITILLVRICFISNATASQEFPSTALSSMLDDKVI